MLNDFKIAFSFLSPYKWFAALSIAVMIVSSFLEAVGIGMIIPILESVNEAGDHSVFTEKIKSVMAMLGIDYEIKILLALFLIIVVAKYAFYALQLYLNRVFASTVRRDMQVAAFNTLMKVPLSFFHKRKTGDLIATLSTSAANASGGIELGLSLVVMLVFSIVYVSLALVISVKLTLFASVLVVITSLLVIPRFRIGFEQGKTEKEVIDRYNSFLIDKLSGIKLVKSTHNEDLHSIQFGEIASNYRSMALRIMINKIIASMSIEPVIVSAAIILVGIAIIELEMSIVPVVAFFYILSRLTPMVKGIHGNWLQIVTYLPHFSRIYQLIYPPEIEVAQDGAYCLDKLESGIILDSVCFAHDHADSDVLRNINIDIRSGQTTALVGMSGGGKTTLVDLIVGHYKPTAGQVLVDGNNITALKKECWLKMIGVVEQEPYLFHDTIFNNIRYGKLDASEEEICRAAQFANADTFIESLPDKYQTIVGERGSRLSGGQKQRICLARALIKDPEILILDEATSALDNESERLIQRSIEKLSNKKTIVVIAHRLSTIIKADKIVVLEEGRVVEEGAHKELYARGGKYYQYYQQGLFANNNQD